MIYVPIVGSFPVGAFGRPWDVFGSPKTLCITNQSIRSSLILLTESIAMSATLDLINEDLYPIILVSDEAVYDPLMVTETGIVQILVSGESLLSIQAVNQRLQRC
jgi:hypothetical protein